MERTITIPLAEVRIALACKKCGTRIVYDVRSWEKGDTECPKCRKADQNRIEAFREALRAVVDNCEDLRFDVRLEVGS